MQLRIDYLNMSYYLPSWEVASLLRDLAQKAQPCTVTVSVVPRQQEQRLPFNCIPVVTRLGASSPAASTL